MASVSSYQPGGDLQQGLFPARFSCLGWQRFAGATLRHGDLREEFFVGSASNKAVYVALALNSEGEKEVLGL